MVALVRSGLFPVAVVFSFVLMSSPSLAADGKALYEAQCQKCHGMDGKGDTKAGKMTKTPDLHTAEWKHGKTAADIAKTLGDKLGKMPSFAEKMTEEERMAVAEYTAGLL